MRPMVSFLWLHKSLNNNSSKQQHHNSNNHNQEGHHCFLNFKVFSQWFAWWVQVAATSNNTSQSTTTTTTTIPTITVSTTNVQAQHVQCATNAFHNSGTLCFSVSGSAIVDSSGESTQCQCQCQFFQVSGADNASKQWFQCYVIKERFQCYA